MSHMPPCSTIVGCPSPRSIKCSVAPSDSLMRLAAGTRSIIAGDRVAAGKTLFVFPATSIELETGVSNHRAPLDPLRRHELIEILRTADQGLKAKRRQSLLHLRHGQDVRQRSIQSR